MEHDKELIANMVEYLSELWETEGSEYFERYFRHLGFTTKDLEEYGLDYTIKWLKEQED